MGLGEKHELTDTLAHCAHSDRRARTVEDLRCDFVGQALCGFTFLNDPLIENGERVPIAGTYECEFKLRPETSHGQKDTWVLLEFSSSRTSLKDYVYYSLDDHKNSNLAMRFTKIAGDLYVAQWSIVKVSPTGGDGASIIMMFMDLSAKGKIVFLIQDMKNKRPDIAGLAAKSSVQLEQSPRENVLGGAHSDILNFFKRHDRSLMIPAYVCQRKTEASPTAADPAADAFVGTWATEVILNITEKDGEFNVNNETYNSESKYSISDGVLLSKTPNQKFVISAISNSIIIFSNNGKEVSRWERIGMSQADGAKSVFSGKWKTKSIYELRKNGNDFFMRSIAQKYGPLGSWQFIDGTLKSGTQILKYDKTRDAITQDIPTGNTTVTRIRIK